MLGQGKNSLGWLKLFAVLLVLVLGVAGCGDRHTVRQATPTAGEAATLGNKLMEVAPPPALQSLRPALEGYLPQVAILQPRANQILKDNTVTVRLQATDFPAFKDADLGLGPHLHFFVDDQPYQAIYDLNQPIVLENLTPGTHTIRVFASRPWHESFKNDGAYAQTTFHVFTKTPKNNPDPTQPLLTYSRPQGSYGAEPVMLDFYLTNVPLHLIAQENAEDDILDWRIRCTVNGEIFLIDDWQPIYLKGFKPGKNWVQLELIDEKGNPLVNAFNNEARVLTYKPGGQDALSRLVRGDLPAAEARGIVDPNYVPESPQPEGLESEPTPALEPPTTGGEPAIEEPAVPISPALTPVEQSPSPKSIDTEATESVEPSPVREIHAKLEPESLEESELLEEPEPSVEPEAEIIQPAIQPEIQPEVKQDDLKIELPAEEPIAVPTESPINRTAQEPLPIPAELPTISPDAPALTEESLREPVSSQFRRSPEIQRDLQDARSPISTQQPRGFFNRFRRSKDPAIAPSPVSPLEPPLAVPDIPEVESEAIDLPEVLELPVDGDEAEN